MVLDVIEFALIVVVVLLLACGLCVFGAVIYILIDAYLDDLNNITNENKRKQNGTKERN